MLTREINAAVESHLAQQLNGESSVRQTGLNLDTGKRQQRYFSLKPGMKDGKHSRRQSLGKLCPGTRLGCPIAGPYFPGKEVSLDGGTPTCAQHHPWSRHFPTEGALSWCFLPPHRWGSCHLTAYSSPPLRLPAFLFPKRNFKWNQLKK